MLSGKNRKHCEVILSGTLVAPLLFQSAVSQNISAQPFGAVAPGDAGSNLWNLVFLGYVLKILGFLTFLFIVGLIYLLVKSSYTERKGEKGQNIEVSKAKSKDITKDKDIENEDCSKNQFKEFCDKMVSSLDDGDAKVERKDDFIKFKYPSGFYFSIKIDKEKFPEDCILTNGKGKKDSLGLECEHPIQNFCKVEKVSKNYVFEERKQKFKSFADQVSKGHGEKAKLTENVVKVQLENGVTCFIVLKKEDIDGMFYPFSVFAKKGEKIFVKRQLFSKLSDAEKYFENLVKNMEECDEQKLIGKSEDVNNP